MSGTVLISVNGLNGSDSNASRTLDATRKALEKVFPKMMCADEVCRLTGVSLCRRSQT